MIQDDHTMIQDVHFHLAIITQNDPNPYMYYYAKKGNNQIYEQKVSYQIKILMLEKIFLKPTHM